MERCPKCSYSRTEEDNAIYPAGECPQCHIIYSKYKPKPQKQNEDQITIAPEEKPEKKPEKKYALVECKECGHEISKKAETCPNCGAKIKKKQTQYGCGCGTFILLGFLFFALIAVFSSNDSSTTPPKTTISDEECIKTLECWGNKHSISAGFRCKSPVEKLANYSHKWTDGMLEPKFSHFRWKSQTTGVVTFIGDRIEFQNGFGAWQNHVYECDYDPSTEQVLDVRARVGRL